MTGYAKTARSNNDKLGVKHVVVSYKNEFEQYPIISYYNVHRKTWLLATVVFDRDNVQEQITRMCYHHLVL